VCAGQLQGEGVTTINMQDNAIVQEAAPACKPAGGAPALTWEWRSFDYQAHQWRAALLRGVRTGSGWMTAETYLLADQSPNSVKLRHDRVEVKQVVHVDADGLEQWKPVGSEAFPLTRAGMHMLCDVWRRPRLEVYASFDTPANLVSYLYKHAADVRVIPLRKWRRGYRVEGCTVERTTVLVGGGVVESLSFEHPDGGTLAAVLRSLHLNPERNTSYVTWLKRLAGLSS
jgi:hypothetical protein